MTVPTKQDAENTTRPKSLVDALEEIQNELYQRAYDRGLADGQKSAFTVIVILLRKLGGKVQITDRELVTYKSTVLMKRQHADPLYGYTLEIQE